VSRLIVFLALLLGFVAGAGVIGGLLLFGPVAAPVVGAPSPSPAAEANPSPSPSPSPSASPSPGGSFPQASAASSSAFRVGQQAPALALQQVGGGIVDRATFVGRRVWVSFTASAEARWGAFAKPIHFWIDRGGIREAP